MAADARAALPGVWIEYPVQSVPIGPLANDRDVDGDAVSFAKVDEGPQHGELHMNSNGFFEYRPNRTFYGDDSFTYFASDGLLDSESPIKVTIHVLPIPLFAGDFDLDDDVDLSDFGILKLNFGVGDHVTEGDADGDGDADLSDFGLLKQNFGRSVQPALATQTLAMLERPSTNLPRRALDARLVDQAVLGVAIDSALDDDLTDGLR
jgi:hypothetical protein